MLGAGRFNALLKLVEEPPPHLKFVFATTEPEKVIATIRSRTHHYPFRLVPPGELHGLPRARSASRRASRSTAARSRSWSAPAAARSATRCRVLDQLIAGAGDDGRHLRRTPPRCSATPTPACSTTSSTRSRPATRAAVFRVVDQVVEAGHDPRRFAEDLLERLRDLIIIDAVPDAAGERSSATTRPTSSSGCASRPPASAPPSSPGPPTSSTPASPRCAAPPRPRLLLELICARVLLPGGRRRHRAASRPGSTGSSGGLDIAGAPAESAAPSRRAGRRAPAARPAAPPRRPRRAAGRARAGRAGSPPRRRPEPAADGGAAPRAGRRAAARRRSPRPAPAAAGRPAGARRPGRPYGGCGRTCSRRSSRLQAAHLDPAQPERPGRRASTDGRLTLGFGQRRRCATASSAAAATRIVREALIEVLGVDWKVEAIVDPSTAPTEAAAAAPPAAAPAGRRAVGAGRRRGRGGRRGRPPTGVPRCRGRPRRPTTRTPTTTRSTHHDLLARELGAKVIGRVRRELASPSARPLRPRTT